MTCPLDAENLNYLWADLLFEEWRRQAKGKAIVIICPGSRSSPLAIAAARRGDGMRTRVVTDERCAGFIALGAAAAGLEPIVITTSGTAVANLLPAVVEASASGRAFLVVTADRPPELHACGANQTIPQRGILGEFVRWAFELPTPTEAVDPTFVLSIAAEARTRSRHPFPGPVHINVPLREPLAPKREPIAVERLASLKEWAACRDRCWRSSTRPMSTALSTDALPGELAEAKRGVIVAGANVDANAVAALAGACGWPVLADIGSGLRTTLPRGADHHVAAVPDLVLTSGDPDLRAALAPDLVLRVGGAVSSKRLNHFVASAARTVVVRDRPTRFDESHGSRHEMLADVASLEPAARTWRRSGALDAWRRAGTVAERAVEASLAAGADLSEPWLARTLIASLPRRGSLVLGNSMPIRDADMHVSSAALAQDIDVIVNRGASGIDGLVSTAVGVAEAGSPTTLLLGDLSLLHDLGGLVNARDLPHPLRIVLVNNDGGGIFHFLPVADALAASGESGGASFERLFGTPHGLRFEHAAALMGLGYRAVRTRDEALGAFESAANDPASTLTECLTDRGANVTAHRAIQGAVQEALARERWS